MNQQRKRPKNIVNGWLNIDKPIGMTSTQVIGRVRRVLSPAKIGHAGTLDPLATGVLPIAMGEATKTIPYMQDAFKTYEFTVTWGEQRSTDDDEGTAIHTSEARPSLNEVKAALPAYVGDIRQTPPQFSAVKIDGKRAYDIARAGEVVEIKSRPAYIESLEVIYDDKHDCEQDHQQGGEHDSEDDAHVNTTRMRMVCGKGTYVRSIARDLGQDLGCFGYVSALRRLGVGAFDDNSAIPLDKLSEMPYDAALEYAVLPLESALDDIPALPITQNEAARLKNGQFLSFVSRHDFERIERLELDQNDGEALAVYEDRPVALIDVNKANIKPIRVFNL